MIVSLLLVAVGVVAIQLDRFYKEVLKNQNEFGKKLNQIERLLVDINEILQNKEESS